MIKQNIQALIPFLPELRSYSIVLMVYLIGKDSMGLGLSYTQKEIMKESGLCQRSLQLAIAQLERMGLLERVGQVKPEFVIRLSAERDSSLDITPYLL